MDDKKKKKKKLRCVIGMEETFNLKKGTNNPS